MVVEDECEQEAIEQKQEQTFSSLVVFHNQIFDIFAPSLLPYIYTQRLTTIIVNIVCTIGTFMGTLNVAGRGGLDDMIAKSRNGHHVNVTIFILTQLVTIVYSSLGIAGAISCNNGLLGVAVIAYCVQICLDLFTGKIVALIRDALCLFPHASLLTEIQNGRRGQRPGQRQQPQEHQGSLGALFLLSPVSGLKLVSTILFLSFLNLPGETANEHIGNSFSLTVSPNFVGEMVTFLEFQITFFSDVQSIFSLMIFCQ